MRYPKLLLSIPSVLLLTTAAASAQPSKVDEARIINHSTAITRPGTYVLDRTIFSSGNGPGIDIRANNVTLDLAGFGVMGPGEKQGIGIQADHVRDVHIHNGSLHGFGVGVLVSNATNVVVDDLQIDGDDLGGAPPDIEIGVMLIDSRGVRVERNVITDTFLGIFVRGDGSIGDRVAQNTVTGGEHGELAICFNPAPGEDPNGGPDGGLIEGNLVSHFNRGISLSTGSTGNIVAGNNLAVFSAAIAEAVPNANDIADNRMIQLAP
jgi:nitrous oxidase accessory protein NosD